MNIMYIGYRVTCNVLHTAFANRGDVRSAIDKFSKGGATRADSTSRRDRPSARPVYPGLNSRKNDVSKH